MLRARSAHTPSRIHEVTYSRETRVPLFAGLDRSGTPDLRDTNLAHNLYVVCIAAVQDLDGFCAGLVSLRYRLGMPADAEFHGHRTFDRTQAAILRIALDAGLGANALLVDKALTRECYGSEVLPAPSMLQMESGIRVVSRFAQRYPLAALWCDEDIKGRKAQKAFVTAIERAHRAVWPDLHVKVRHGPSNKSDMVQLSDVLAYAIGKLARHGRQQPELVRILERITSDSGNAVEGPQQWQAGVDEG